jgi:hypothetical protein
MKRFFERLSNTDPDRHRLAGLTTGPMAAAGQTERRPIQPAWFPHTPLPC